MIQGHINLATFKQKKSVGIFLDKYVITVVDYLIKYKVESSHIEFMVAYNSAIITIIFTKIFKYISLAMHESKKTYHFSPLVTISQDAMVKRHHC